MLNRMQLQKVKLGHMSGLFERELAILKVYYFKRFKKKNYKQVTIKLDEIKPQKKDALLKEYFIMCRMLYRVRAKISMDLEEAEAGDSLDKMKELFVANESF